MDVIVVFLRSGGGDQLEIRCKDHDVTNHDDMLMSFPLQFLAHHWSQPPWHTTAKPMVYCIEGHELRNCSHDPD
jgi:hypothetical protein